MEKKPYMSLYWKCQLIGWSVAALYWTFQGWSAAGSFRFDIAVVQFISDVAMYILITHLYHNFANKNRWQDLALEKLIWRMLIVIPVMGIFYTVVTISKLYLVRLLFLSHPLQSFADFFSLNAAGIFVAGIRLIAIWLLAYHLYHYAKREIRLSVENTRLALSFKQSQLDNLSAQLNPHFLFNALNNIKSLVYTRPDNAGRAIDLLGELLRSGLYKGSAMLIRLNEEIDLVRDYLELEGLRMEERLQYELDIDISRSGLMVPRLCIQTLVENAVKHGISLEKQGGKIEVIVNEQNGFISIRVLNPGKLKQDKTVAGIGLQNLKERLGLSYQHHASFNLYEMEQKVCAEIKIPIR
ncbi:sensor histidine kinase [Pedobacter psychrodurus]|uniref:Sensor histidine kinase n=1 Tax=Pedobacter psychrodurus TaxID=2530456 RepID=A0A4R0PQH3_9SPHI|nr:histidine kinase [Pedobacter psychrodurus]TCD18616.1 sensor histidine kinase [Pedobacter psychrodurus]